MDEDGDFLVNRIHLQKQGALVPEVLLLVLEIDLLLSERNPAPHAEHAGPEVQEGHLVSHCCEIRKVKVETGECDRWVKARAGGWWRRRVICSQDKVLYNGEWV